MRLLDVHYRFIDRDTGHAGQGNALVRLDGRQDFDPDDPQHREALELHIKEAIAQEFPQHKTGRLVLLITRCTAAEKTL